jgi:ribosomal protein S1
MVHVSELADGYVKSPSDVVKIGQEVTVRVLKVTRKKKQLQIDLTMKERIEPVSTFVADEPEEETAPTAMAMALRKAMRTARDEVEVEEIYEEEDEDYDFRPARKRDKREKRRYRDQQDDIISRTLRNHTN